MQNKINDVVMVKNTVRYIPLFVDKR